MDEPLWPSPLDDPEPVSPRLVLVLRTLLCSILECEPHPDPEPVVKEALPQLGLRPEGRGEEAAGEPELGSGDAPAAPFLFMGEPFCIQHMLLLFLLMCGPIQHLLCKPIFGLALLIVSEPILHASPPFLVMGEPFLIMGEPFLILGEPISSPIPGDAPATQAAEAPVAPSFVLPELLEVASAAFLHLYMREPATGLIPGVAPASPTFLFMCEPFQHLTPGLLVAALVQDRFFVSGRSRLVQSTNWPPRASCCFCSSPEPGWWPDPCGLVHHLASSGFLLLLWELMVGLAPGAGKTPASPLQLVMGTVPGLALWDAPAIPFLSMGEPIIFMCEPISGPTPWDGPASHLVLIIGEPILFIGKPILLIGEPIQRLLYEPIQRLLV